MKDYQGDKALELNKQVIKLTEDVKVRDGLLAQMASETGAEILRLRAEIDRYDKICTEVRNELTAAGIPELTEDRLTVVPLAKRVALLRSELERVKAENEWHKYPDEKPVVPDGSYGVDIWGEYEVEFDAFDGVRFEKVIGQVQFLLSDFEEKEYYDPPQLLDINNNPIHKLLRWTALPAAPEEGE